jgi:hypothetical protein
MVSQLDVVDQVHRRSSLRWMGSVNLCRSDDLGRQQRRAQPVQLGMERNQFAGTADVRHRR